MDVLEVCRGQGEVAGEVDLDAEGFPHLSEVREDVGVDERSLKNEIKVAARDKHVELPLLAVIDEPGDRGVCRGKELEGLLDTQRVVAGGGGRKVLGILCAASEAREVH
jgi:hypothetical protein